MSLKSNIKDALEFTLRWEGGYVNDKDDPGGETKWGISKRAHPDRDIANLTLEDAIEIYREKYWDVLDCDNLDWALAIAVFDAGVNCGVSRARAWLKESSWIEDCNVLYDIKYFNELRIIHYLTLIKNNPAMGKYKRGWFNRVNDLKKYIDTQNV